MNFASRWFPWLMRRASRYHEPLVAARKRKLLADLAGDVLEIGPGDGVNLQYLASSVRWTGYEPNPVLAARIAVPRNGRLFIRPFALDLDRYDSAIVTLVLCSVENQTQVLRDIRDSLRPGGRLVFVEHVASTSGSSLRRSQDRWQPLWGYCAGGCHPNRDTERAIRDAGFAIESIEHFDLPMWLAGPHIAGVARRGLLT